MKPLTIIKRIKELGGDINHAERYLEKVRDNHTRYDSMEVLDSWIKRKLAPTQGQKARNGFRQLG